jgi:hypothetical protein
VAALAVTGLIALVTATPSGAAVGVHRGGRTAALAGGAGSPTRGSLGESRLARAALNLRSQSALTDVPREVPKLEPNDALPRPAWWDGPCDVGDNGISYQLAARFDGLQDCGPGSGVSGQDYLTDFFTGSWGEYEWECVELSMRWMYMAWGVAPYAANGNGVVPNYPHGEAGYPDVTDVANGTKGEAPQPGDVLSIDDSNPDGHTEVVSASSVNGLGNGFVTVITENNPTGASGWATLSVADWVVSDGIPGDAVVGWLHNPGWTLEEPVLWNVTAAGDLEIADGDALGAPSATVATGVAVADVIGGDGYSPTPAVVALTTTGELEGGYYVPGLTGRSLTPIASGVKSFSLAAGPGVSGHPVLAWVTDAGNVEVSDGGLFQPPVAEASGATAVEVAPDSGPGGAVIGYLSSNHTFYDRQGPSALTPGTPWNTVAGNVSSMALAGGDQPAADVVEAYVSAGTFYARQGMAGSFTAEASDVSQIAVTTVGVSATPLLAYLSGGDLWAERGAVTDDGFAVQATGVTAVSVSAGMSSAGFSIVGAVTNGKFEAEDGRLNGQWTTQASGVSSAGVAALTVS